MWSSFWIPFKCKRLLNLENRLVKRFSCLICPRWASFLLQFEKKSNVFYVRVGFYWIFAMQLKKKSSYLILRRFRLPTLPFLTKTNSFVEAFSCLFTACLSPQSRWCINGQKKAESCMQTEHCLSLSFQSSTVIMAHSRETR